MTGSPQQPQHPQHDEQQRGRRLQSVNKFYKEFAPFLTLGVQLAVAVIFFYFLGSWVDERYGTAPTFTLVGVLLGTVGGLVKFFKTVADLDKKDKSQNSPKDTGDREG